MVVIGQNMATSLAVIRYYFVVLIFIIEQNTFWFYDKKYGDKKYIHTAFSRIGYKYVYILVQKHFFSA